MILGQRGKVTKGGVEGDLEKGVQSGGKQCQSFKHLVMTEYGTITADICVEWWRGDLIKAFRRSVSFHRQ